MFGTLEYMAPEQASGASLTPASDWYAVGTMLYEAITGRLPFGGSMFDVLAAKRQSDAGSAAPVQPGRARRRSSSSACSLLAPAADRAPRRHRRAGDPGRRHRGADASCPSRRPWTWSAASGTSRRCSTRSAPSVAGTAHLGVRARAVGHGQERGRRALHRRAAIAVAGAGAVAGRCYEQESVRYKALDSLVDALSRHLAQLPPEEGPGTLLPADVALLAQMFPMLERVDEIHARAGRAPGDSQPAGTAQPRVGRPLPSCSTRWPRRQPLVLAIDDLQWGDSDSAALLLDIFSGPHAPAVLLVGSLSRRARRRQRVPDGAAATRTRRWRASGASWSIDALDAADAERLALGLLGRDFPMAAAMAARIAQESGGSPFFIRALVDHVQAESQLAEPGAAGRRHHARRSAAAPLQPPAAGRPAAARRDRGGRPADLPRPTRIAAAGIAERDPALLSALRAAQMVRSASGDLRELETYHDRVREAVVASLAGAALADTHRRLAETLDAQRHGRPRVAGRPLPRRRRPARAATHYARAAEIAAGRWPSIARQTCISARSTLERRHRQRALRLAGRPRPTRWPTPAAAGWRPRRISRPRASRRPTRRSSSSARRAIRYLHQRAHRRGPRGAGRLHDAGRAPPAADSTRAALLPLAIRSARLWLLERLGPAAPAPARPRPLSATGADAHRHRLGRGRGALRRGPRARRGAQGPAPADGPKLGEPGRLAQSLALQATAVSQMGETRATPRAGAASRPRSSSPIAVGTPHTRAMVLVAQSFADDDETQAWRQAYESLDEAERLLRDHCTGVSWELSLVHISRISIQRIEGQYGEAVRRGLSVLAEAQHRGDIFTEARIGIFVLVDQQLLAGRFAEGRQVLRELSREWFRGRFPGAAGARLLPRHQHRPAAGSARHGLAPVPAVLAAHRAHADAPGRGHPRVRVPAARRHGAGRHRRPARRDEQR